MRIIIDLGFKLKYHKINSVKAFTPLAKIPFLNEFFTNLTISVL